MLWQIYQRLIFFYVVSFRVFTIFSSLLCILISDYNGNLASSQFEVILWFVGCKSSFFLGICVFLCFLFWWLHTLFPFSGRWCELGLIVFESSTLRYYISVLCFRVIIMHTNWFPSDFQSAIFCFVWWMIWGFLLIVATLILIFYSS